MLNGQIHVKNGNSYPYQLVINIKGTEISGYTITKLKNGIEPKASIKGSIDSKTKTLTFAEVSSSDEQKNAITCFVNTTLQGQFLNNKYVLKGPFKGKDHYSMYCGEGMIEFSEPKMLYAILDVDVSKLQLAETAQIKAQQKNMLQHNEQQYNENKIAQNNQPQTGKNNEKQNGKEQVTNGSGANEQVAKKQSENISKDLYSKQTSSKKIAPPIADTLDADGGEYEITSGISKQFLWHSDTCIFDIYDGGVIDGDIITVIFNADEVLTKYTLTKKKYQLKLYLKGKVNTISIFAENLGKTPPNTANIILTDGKRHYKIKAFNDIGESAEMTLKKK